MPNTKNNTYGWERRSLQYLVVLTAAFPIALGLIGIFRGPTMFDAKFGHLLSADLDNHFRYMSGCLLGLGLILLSAVGKIEQETTKIRVCCSVPFFGALGRAWAMFVVGNGVNFLSLGGTCVEVLFTLAIILWQGRIARFKQPERNM